MLVDRPKNTAVWTKQEPLLISVCFGGSFYVHLELVDTGVGKVESSQPTGIKILAKQSLSAFTKLRNVIISFVSFRSVRPSVRMKRLCCQRKNFMKSNFENFSKQKNSTKIQFSLNSNKSIGNFNDNIYTFITLCRRILLGKRNISDKIIGKIKTHFVLCSMTFFPRILPFYETTWNNRYSHTDHKQYGTSALHTGYIKGYRHKHRTCNTYCFPTEKRSLHERASVLRNTNFVFLVISYFQYLQTAGPSSRAV
jgi:hypothetical protein